MNEYYTSAGYIFKKSHKSKEFIEGYRLNFGRFDGTGTRWYWSAVVQTHFIWNVYPLYTPTDEELAGIIEANLQE